MISQIKFLMVMFAVAALAACGGGGSTEEEIKEAAIANSVFSTKAVAYGGATVDVYGDSISIGVGVEVSPIMRLTEYRPNWVVDHHSAGGLRLDAVISGYSEPFQNANPIYYPKGPQLPFTQVVRTSRFIVVGVGINDAINDSTQLDAERFEHNLRYLVRTILEEKRVPIITGVVNIGSNPAFREHYNNVTHKIAQEFNLVHAGWGEAYAAEGVGSDTIHPNQMGSDRLAGRLIEAIDKAIAQNGNGDYDRFASYRSEQVK